MAFKDYLNKVISDKRYHYRLKTVVPLDDKALDAIEHAVRRYMPLDMSRVTKTILQKTPLDFPGLQNMEVFMVDLVLGLPASAYVLQQEFKTALGIPEKYVVVRADNEPLEIDGQILNAEEEIRVEARDKKLKPASLLANPDYPEAVPVDACELYGSEYNSGLLDYMAQVAATRDKENVDPPSPLFSWLNMPKSDVPPVSAPRPSNQSNGGTSNRSMHGNMDQDTYTVRRLYQDETGKPVVLTRTINSIRKETVR